MKQIYILLSYVFDNYLKTCKFLEVPSPSYNLIYSTFIAIILLIICNISKNIHRRHCCYTQSVRVITSPIIANQV
jgi:hypothetical protein